MPITVARTAAARSAGGATLLLGAWLFLAAMPVMADGGPHIGATNSGVSTLTADSCAGCHRAHTAQAEYLLNQAAEDLCFTCHGAAAGGATTTVVDGIQYRTTGRAGTPVLGALRSGGFVQAAIDTKNAARLLTGNALSDAANAQSKVRVLTDGAGTVITEPVTSAHLNLADNGMAGPTVAWGNGDIGPGDTGPGPSVTLGCTSCHNPHGNGNYRILNSVPVPDGAGFVPVPTLVVPAPVNVADSPVDNPNPLESDTKNYTVIQTKGIGTPVPAVTSFLLYADDVVAANWGPTTGDYWHVRVPWNSASGANDAPNGRPVASGGIPAFNTQMTSWCTACHTRYYNPVRGESSGDQLFAYRHETISNRACTTCHVAHGSNAAMTGPFARSQPFPNGDVPAYTINGIANGDSRLLKVDGRGTCQLCHDPTYTKFLSGDPYTGPLPRPGVP